MGKNIYIGVDNVSRKVKQPIIGVDNIARNVKSGFIGVDNVARQFFQGGIPISNFSVGDTVYLKESGVKQAYLVVNKGIPSNSSLYDSSCDGVWLLRKDCIENQVWASSGNPYYDSSSIHSWLNSTMLAKYDSAIQNAIIQVKIPYYRSGTVYSGSNGLSCKLFLLAGVELGFPTTAGTYTPVDGALLTYFESGTGTSANNKRIAYMNGSACDWWLRSPVMIERNKAAWLCLSSGGIGGNGCRLSYPVRPAMILPYEALVEV